MSIDLFEYYQHNKKKTISFSIVVRVTCLNTLMYIKGVCYPQISSDKRKFWCWCRITNCIILSVIHIRIIVRRKHHYRVSIILLYNLLMIITTTLMMKRWLSSNDDDVVAVVSVGWLLKHNISTAYNNSKQQILLRG